MMLRRRNKPAQKDQNRVHPVTDPIPGDSEVAPRKPRNTSFFRLPGLFVGFGAKSTPDATVSPAACAAGADSARSPTSPLEYRVFSNLGKSSFVLSPRSSGPDAPRNSWDCSRVGLGLVDSLSDGSCSPGTVLGFSDSRCIVFGSQMRINISSPRISVDRPFRNGERFNPSPDSLLLLPSRAANDDRSSSPAGDTACRIERQSRACSRMASREFGKVHSWSADTGVPPSSSSSSSIPGNWSSGMMKPKSNSEAFLLDASNQSNLGGCTPPLMIRDAMDLRRLLIASPARSHGIVGPLSPRDIELSEDYTRIITHGPNPKTTHFFGDCILESLPGELPDFADGSSLQGVEEVVASPWLVSCQVEDILLPPPPADDFLSSCFFCKKKLEGKDIYMYRGEKAFCSCECREKEISIEEENEKERASNKQSEDDNYFPNGITITAT